MKFPLITLVTAIANKMTLPERYDPEIDELSKDVKPEKVLDTMERQILEVEKSSRFSFYHIAIYG